MITAKEANSISLFNSTIDKWIEKIEKEIKQTCYSGNFSYVRQLPKRVSEESKIQILNKFKENGFKITKLDGVDNNDKFVISWNEGEIK